MRKHTLSFLCFFSLSASVNSYAEVKETVRIPQFSNTEVSVWQTVIYPHKEQILKMHRHEHNRVVVALDSGILKVVNNKGKEHFLKLEKDKAYFLTKDMPGELHTDENIGNNPIRVIVMELNK
ncbi:hypothetical protein OQJ18_15470 [Fluoribacter dumoffii]|uniref:Cupin domain n=1 Tax=Fluoribacter dumoffii TaxID=463 RepID=A0A377GDM6_9GAMM|nr:hypothetical protein [Fluoribacter dumoffii]KTC91018.1 hypothetical protein Ldum_2086 [Fluoribacter dumoffii NY 23]MCW8386587.1 hypothetical protein [Fluoribacter dumoffii]MCW8419641.1 hypothetical protein [Fluoribacter dumoffii]MCW8455656.1 hypothetical protein [Fluoribacter dumoffii]MCW8460265.1 hypothetical protein [Fluoribacter dumoffii]